MQMHLNVGPVESLCKLNWKMNYVIKVKIVISRSRLIMLDYQGHTVCQGQDETGVL